MAGSIPPTYRFSSVMGIERAELEAWNKNHRDFLLAGLLVRLDGGG